jgi:hypothetical protein
MRNNDSGGSPRTKTSSGPMGWEYLLLAGVGLGLCGCASPRTYTQPGASGEHGRSAKVICESDHTHSILQGLNQKVFIAAIDGKTTSTLTGALTDTEPFAEIAYVTPGRHYLDLKYSHLNHFAWGKVWFDAEAGGNYIVRRKIEGYSVMLWVQDQQSGKPVGGIPGGEPSTTPGVGTPSDSP